MNKLLAVTALVFAACLPKMKDTNRPASPTTWDTIVQNAQKAGYTTDRKDEGAREGKYFWYVKATYASGTIYYTRNNSTKNVAFACDGSLGDKGSCDSAGLALINGQ